MSYQQHTTTTQQQPIALSRSKGSNTSTSSISVIVGKTFEATTHPTNGTQQIIEVTKYKRLSDGFIYKETKLRSLEEVLSYDNDDDNSNVVEERVGRESSRDDDVENVGHHHRRVSSGAVTARIHNSSSMKSQASDPPAANNGSISMRNLGPQHPLRQITNQQQQPCPPSSISPQRHPIKPSTNKGGSQQMYPEQEVLSTFSSSYSSNTLGEEQSVITEEHEVFPSAFPQSQQQQQQQGERRYRQQQGGKLSKGGYGQNGRDNNEGKHYFDEESESYVEEYTYENDAKEYDAQAWQHQQQLQQQQEQYQQEQGRDNVEGWNPFGTDNSIDDDSIQLNNRLPSKQQQGNKSNKKLSVSTFFNSGNQYDEEEDNSPIDLKNDNEEDTPNSSSGGGMFNRSKSNNKLICNCRNISICAMLLVVVGIVVTIGLLVPSIKKNQSPSNLEEEQVAPSCIDLGNIDLQIVISSTDSNVEDVNSWSLTRADENGTVTTINSVDDLPELTNEDDLKGQQYIYKNCVEPGLYTFTISDSVGNGLGGGELNEDEDDSEEGGGLSSGYYIIANDVTLGVSSFFFHEEKMTFTLPFDAEEVEDTSDETAGEEEMDTVCTDDFFLAIKTDGKPNESTWNVIDNDTQEEVLSGGPYDMEWSVYTHRACLPNGHYTFNMFDEGEDGVCCDGGKGFFVLQKDGKTIVNSNGEFGSVKSVEFMLGSEEV